ncbi:uncharacterized protein LOC124404391 isoform X1 [Diprion similis]|uniref:uncharacterized protein LOC124404391 isoform X1 n=1 Tax=Diprion similis TaxID=362088 RepID=UPI001EF8AD12|nr:uncharacterized protein LOC124404391 isoform X1 [Diprion similis]
MYSTCHPAFYDIEKLGCTNALQITIAFQTYIELCEVKQFWDVQYKYNKLLDLIYLEACTTKSSPLQKYIPWPAVNTISLNHIEQMQNELKSERLTLVFVEGDSTSIYYCVSAGLVKPASPEQSKKYKKRQEKKIELESEIRKNASNLYELATSVESKECQSNLQLSAED